MGTRTEACYGVIRARPLLLTSHDIQQFNLRVGFTSSHQLVTKARIIISLHINKYIDQFNLPNILPNKTFSCSTTNNNSHRAHAKISRPPLTRRWRWGYRGGWSISHTKMMSTVTCSCSRGWRRRSTRSPWRSGRCRRHNALYWPPSIHETRGLSVEEKALTTSLTGEFTLSRLKADPYDQGTTKR